MIKGSISDENGQTAEVLDNGALVVTNVLRPALPLGTRNRQQLFSQLVSDDGTESGTTNMNVNGSATSQEFYIGSDANVDLHIMKISIVIADSAVSHDRFGNINALANGWTLRVIESGIETNIILDAQTGGQVLAQSALIQPYGAGVTVNELSNWTSTQDAQTILVDISSLVPNGIRIGMGSQDKIVSIINDNLTGLTEFTVRILGFKNLQ